MYRYHRGFETKEAFRVWDETELGDHRQAGRKQRYDDLANKEKLLLASRDRLLAGGPVVHGLPPLPPHPWESDFGGDTSSQ